MSELKTQAEGKNTKEGKAQYLIFSLGHESYGIELLKNKEVINVPELTSVPYTENYVLGVANLRGQIIPVIDLKCKLGIATETSPIKAQYKVIVVEINSPQKIQLGLLVDGIRNVEAIAQNEIEELSENNKKHHKQEYVKGVYSYEDNLALLIDIEKLIMEDIKKEDKNAG